MPLGTTAHSTRPAVRSPTGFSRSMRITVRPATDKGADQFPDGMAAGARRAP
ncbi:hypothetical protein GCM10017752_52740 [Streptomyces roseoviridis]